MKRRNFLGFLAGGVAAGPGLARSAAQATMADLSLKQVGVSAVGSAPMPEGPNRAWAAERLKKFIAQSPEQIAHRRRHHWVDGLDAEVASLRSVALHKKIAMSKEIAYERSQKSERGYLEGVIAGWWE